MKKQKGQFDTNIFGEQKKTDSTQPYEYVFSTGVQADARHSIHPKQKQGGRIALRLLTLFLCVTLSFAAGVGGVFYANSLLEVSDDADDLERASNDDTLYHSNPESLLEKNDNSSPVYGSAGEDVFSVSEVAKRVGDTVVVLNVVFSVETFYGTQTASGAGSGVLISSDGYILTCYHVVADDAAKTKSISVTLNSGTVYDAAFVGGDASSDLAVIKIEPREEETFPFAEHGKSNRLVVGEHVVAIGNPLGTLGGTVTDGIISATERNIQTSDGTKMTLLQTNAAINSGNSGGGLFNLDGQLIGIVNAKYVADSIEGLAFAIPIDAAYEVELELIRYGYVRGVVDHGLQVWDVTAENLRSNYYYYSIKTVGVYVLTSSFNTDLQYKDRIVSVNGVTVKTEAELESVTDTCKVGDVLTIVYEREDQTYTTELTLGEYVPAHIKNQTETEG